MSSTGFGSTTEGFAVVEAARAQVRELKNGAFQRILTDDFDEFGRALEQLNRELWAALVAYAHEADQRGLAAYRGCSSTRVMLQQSLNIPVAEAGLRVNAARMILAQDLPSGGEAPPVLPLLAAAVDAGAVDPSHVSTALATMKRLPPMLPAELRVLAEEALVRNAVIIDPDQFKKVARHLEETIDPDGTLDERDPASKAEFHIGARSVATGLTSISGRLDDLGIATLRKSIDGLSAPTPTIDGVRDDRPAATRRAHALVEVLTLALKSADLPEQGGERPQITVTLDWDMVKQRIGVATLDDGGTLTAADARRLLCDANIIPAVLGGKSEVLDLGRAQRTFNRATRRAIAGRDNGCAFPGCCRPPAWCDAHHVQWWARDLGETSYGNGVLLCQYHHSLIHKGEWQIVFAPDGIPEFVPPRWLDPRGRPRRNTVHSLTPTG